MYTLVVVDMQEGFDAALEPDVVVGVAQEIMLAKELGYPILVLEYADCGSTHYGLLRLLSGYKRKAKVTKFDDDGSRAVVQTLRRRNFVQDKVRLCGVNTDCCVLSTVIGLIERAPKMKIEVSKRACWTIEDSRFDWRTFPKYKNLKLV